MQPCIYVPLLYKDSKQVMSLQESGSPFLPYHRHLELHVLAAQAGLLTESSGRVKA
jgi:hypothetical protein